MELEHNFTVAAPIDQAWDMLLDLERIAPCMPGATLTSYEGDEFTGNVRVKLGPVTMTFTGKGRFVERDVEARRVAVEASGKDKRGGGTARATVTSTLQPDGDVTAVSVHSDLVVTGRVAQFGRGMIADVSTRLLGQFTDCLSRQLDAPAAPPEEPAAPPEEAAAAPAAAPLAEPAAEAATTPGPPARTPAAAPTAAAARTEAVPIDLLGVTGIRAAVGRSVPYLLTFLLGALVGGGLVALLVR
jgi:carbon monoxide dehydrogenase subunit G